MMGILLKLEVHFKINNKISATFTVKRKFIFLRL